MIVRTKTTFGLIAITILLTAILVLSSETRALAADDYISKKTIVGEGNMVDVSKYAKEGPYRIGFSNGFSGNSWRYPK